MATLLRASSVGRTVVLQRAAPAVLRLRRDAATAAADAPVEKKRAQTPLQHSAALGRPLSPDLAIYQPQYTWILSGFYRVSSIGLSTGIFAGAIAYGVSSHELMYYVASVKALSLPAVLPFAVKFTLGFPISFHVYNGIRHLVWDSGRALELPAVYKGAYAVLGASAVTSALLAFL